MSSAYDPALSTDKDIVRLLLGDTDQTQWFLSDAEIDYVVGATANINLAAGQAAHLIAAKFARMVDHSIGGDINVRASQLYDHYRQLSALYLERGGGAIGLSVFVGAYAGGISRSDSDARAADSDRVRPLGALTPEGDAGGFVHDLEGG